MEVSPKPRGEEKRGDLTKVRDEKVQCMCVREGERGRGDGGGVGVGMVAHSSFLCHQLSWVFACSVFHLSVIRALG